MALKDLKSQISEAMSKIRKKVDESLNAKIMRQLGEYAIELIQKRTRLGYGVRGYGEKKYSLKAEAPHSQKYKEYRKKNSDKLGEFTTPTRQNLTFTGQMLESLKVISATIKKAVIEATGTRDDGLTNKKVAQHVSEARPFLNITDLEIKQILRYWRQIFGDLKKK